jgi:3-phosphoshikimate 1-carboxyvinyltransferase
MGVEVSSRIQREELGEPVGPVTVQGRPASGVQIGPDQVPSVIDELPLVALLGTQATGTTTVRGAEELRVKETDRIDAVVTALRAMGAHIEALPDGFVVHGPTSLTAARVNSLGDHRLAMMLAVAGLVARGTTTIDGADAAAVSFPTFATEMTALGAILDAG